MPTLTGLPSFSVRFAAFNFTMSSTQTQWLQFKIREALCTEACRDCVRFSEPTEIRPLALSLFALHQQHPLPDVAQQTFACAMRDEHEYNQAYTGGCTTGLKFAKFWFADHHGSGVIYADGEQHILSYRDANLHPLSDLTKTHFEDGLQAGDSLLSQLSLFFFFN